jgi:hypothetical protein
MRDESRYGEGSDVIAALRDRVSHLERRIEGQEARIDLVKRDAVIVLLNLLGRSLKHVASGEFDIEEIAASVATSATGISATGNPRWDAIKQRNPGRIAQAIETLLVHGTMSTAQLAAAMRMNRSNCSNNVVTKMNSMGMLQRDGSNWKLKDLP